MELLDAILCTIFQASHDTICKQNTDHPYNLVHYFYPASRTCRPPHANLAVNAPMYNNCICYKDRYLTE